MDIGKDHQMSDDFRFIVKHPHHCCTEVSRKGELQPCDRPAVAVGICPDEGNMWPVCAYHTRFGYTIPLGQLIEGIKAHD